MVQGLAAVMLYSTLRLRQGIHKIRILLGMLRRDGGEVEGQLLRGVEMLRRVQMVVRERHKVIILHGQLFSLVAAFQNEFAN